MHSNTVRQCCGQVLLRAGKRHMWQPGRTKPLAAYLHLHTHPFDPTVNKKCLGPNFRCCAACSMVQACDT